jgi:hypothetical protein
LVRTECLPDERRRVLRDPSLAADAKGCGDILEGVLSCQAKLRSFGLVSSHTSFNHDLREDLPVLERRTGERVGWRRRFVACRKKTLGYTA